MTQLSQSAERLLRLFQCPAPLGAIGQAILQQQPDIAVSDTDRRAKLMCKHMQNVVYLNRHSDFRAYHTNPPAVARALKLPTASNVVTPTRILLVDDYPDALEMWGLYLRSMGYDVVTAEDGLKAVEEAHRTLPDIIILDLDLPGITGFEAAIRLRKAPDTAQIPLIAATCFSHPTQLDRARQCGFDSILVKPCEPVALVAEVRRLLLDGRLENFERVPVKTDQKAPPTFGNPLGHNL